MARVFQPQFKCMFHIFIFKQHFTSMTTIYLNIMFHCSYIHYNGKYCNKCFHETQISKWQLRYKTVDYFPKYFTLNSHACHQFVSHWVLVASRCIEDAPGSIHYLFYLFLCLLSWKGIISFTKNGLSGGGVRTTNCPALKAVLWSNTWLKLYPTTYENAETDLLQVLVTKHLLHLILKSLRWPNTVFQYTGVSKHYLKTTYLWVPKISMVQD